MANLVTPGYDRTSLVSDILHPYEERTLEFRGLNRNSAIEEGEMSDMRNLTSDNYPLLTPRKLRGLLELPEGVKKPLSILAKYGKIAMIAQKEDDRIAFFFDGEEVTALTGLSEESYMVSINRYICFFPENLYVRFYRNGDEIHYRTVGSLGEKTEVARGSVFFPPGKNTARIYFGEFTSFAKNDAITIVGDLFYTPPGGTETRAYLNTSCLVSETSNGSVIEIQKDIVTNLIGADAENITFTGEVRRNVPYMTHVVEWNNRLWGANSINNTIYACKLGDPTNWEYYQGTSLDSFYAEQGTDGDWTGCAAYSGHLIFFKENSMTKIYGTSPATFQVTNAVCYGVENGSSKSVAIVNDIVLYKSSIGIMAYEGGTPYSISNKLGEDYKNVVSGTEGRKYYASIERNDGTYELLVLDVERAVWHKEDDVRFRDCCTWNGKLYFINAVDTDNFGADKVYIVNPDDPTETKRQRVWEAVFGPFDENIEGKKIFSKMSLRFVTHPETIVTIYISINDGGWERIKQLGYVEKGGVTVPIVPRRCDRFAIRLVGTGDCEIKSLTRRYRRGSDNR